MAGGTWTSQNKLQPGVYINVKSKGNLMINIGDRGIVAIPAALSWGTPGSVIEIIPGEDLTKHIGYDMTHEKAMFLREMMKGSDTTPGPSKILLYRLPGKEGVKASATIGGLVATALYDGVRGNDISIIVGEDPENDGVFEVQTVIDGSVADEQRVSGIAELHSNTWVSFTKAESGEITDTAGTPLTGGTDPTVETADYSAFLTVLEPYKFDVLIYDGTDKIIMQAFTSFIKRMNDNVGQKCQLVMAEATSSNSEYVISVDNGVLLDDGSKITPQQATWWLGGAEAAAPYNKSLTYSQYPNAVEANPKLSTTDIDKKIASGAIVFLDTFGKVKVCTDINTLTSFTVDKGQEFSKNRVMRVISTFCNDLSEYFSMYYIGKIDNNDAGRALLRGWIVGYLNEMQANNGIQNFSAEDVEVLPGNSIDSVVVNVALQPVDSVEKIYVTVTVSVNVTE